NTDKTVDFPASVSHVTTTYSRNFPYRN
ncbi:ATP synthase alpha/beta family, beta-barrel domain protein, partial [Chlamydia psittaci 02DC14]